MLRRAVSRARTGRGTCPPEGCGLLCVVPLVSWFPQPQLTLQPDGGSESLATGVGLTERTVGPPEWRWTLDISHLLLIDEWPP